MTNAMMFGSLVSMVTAQALVWCLTGCFTYNNNWEKTPSHSGKKHFFFTNNVYNGLCNEPKWLAGLNYLQRKKSEKLQFAKTGLFSQYPHLTPKNSPDKHYFGSLHRMFVNFQPEPRKAGKVKSMEKLKCYHLSFPCKCEHWKLHRIEKNIPRARSYHFCKNF